MRALTSRRHFLPWFGSALVLAVILLLQGCESPSIAELGDETAPQTSGPEDGSLPAAQQAYYMLNYDDIQKPGWEAKLQHYRVFVCDPSFDNGELQRIRNAVPDAILLAATSAQDIPIHVYRRNPYFVSLSAQFDSTLCIRDVETGNVARVYSPDPTNPDVLGIPAYIMSRESADVLVEFHRRVTMFFEWDGLYIDMLNDVWSRWRKQRLEQVTNGFDIDNDGIADSMQKLDQVYRTWRPYFTARLREELGEEIILVGNAGGRLADPAINGISLERVGDRFSLYQARWYFMIQDLYSNYPPLSIAWVFEDTPVPPSAQLVNELEGMYFGVVDQ